MKIAYLIAGYPGVSHTFVMREIQALRERGVVIETFSIRPPPPDRLIDADARQEAARTRCLMPPPAATLLRALTWMVLTRPLLSVRTLGAAILAPGMNLRQRGLWLCYFLEAALLAYWLVRGRFERIHCHFGNNGASVGMLAARLAGVPFSMTCHGSELLEPARHRLREKVARADFVACVSRHGRAQLMLACPPEQWHKLHIVRCGLEKSRKVEKSKSQNGDEWRQRSDDAPGNDDELTHRYSERSETQKGRGLCEILCVGRLSHEKGHLLLIEALARLRERGCAVRLTLVGDGPMRGPIEARLRELRLNECVRLTGALPPEDVAACYRQADLFVLPSLSEGVPVVLMEAMSHGVPVVATRAGGVAELVEHGVSGLVVAPGDVDELTDAIERLVREPALAERLAAAGVMAVHSGFRIDQAADRLLSLLTRPRKSPRPVSTRPMKDELDQAVLIGASAQQH